MNSLHVLKHPAYHTAAGVLVGRIYVDLAAEIMVKENDTELLCRQLLDGRLCRDDVRNVKPRDSRRLRGSGFS